MRKIGTGQEEAQLLDCYMMMMIVMTPLQQITALIIILRYFILLLLSGLYNPYEFEPPHS